MKGKVVIASGVFDILHIGHIMYLKNAKRLAGKNGTLIVIIARDSLVKKIKGKKPLLNERERKIIVSSIKFVDKVILGPSKSDLISGMKVILRKYKPNILAIGYDQNRVEEAFKKIIEEEPSFKEVKLVKLRRYGPKNSKSSLIKKFLI